MKQFLAAVIGPQLGRRQHNRGRGLRCRSHPGNQHHVCNAPGTFKAALSVTDAKGATGS